MEVAYLTYLNGGAIMKKTITGSRIITEDEFTDDTDRDIEEMQAANMFDRLLANTFYQDEQDAIDDMRGIV